MAKKNFKEAIEKKLTEKVESVNHDNNATIIKLENRVKELEETLKQSNTDISVLNVSDITLSNNVRDDEFNYKYEEIESLADDIGRKGQLQPVLVSKDNFLLTGYRRTHAIMFLQQNDPEKFKGDILVYHYPKSFNEISIDELIDIQVAENKQRREIDNFQLSKLYNKMMDEGHTQQRLAERFRKSPSLISMTLSISNINLSLVELLKQFQVYGWSQENFNALKFSAEEAIIKSEGIDYDYEAEKQLKKYEKMKGTIGILPLNAIGKHKSFIDQKKAFLTLYATRLSDEELKSDLFRKELKELKKKTSYNHFTAAKRAISTLNKVVSEIKKDLPEKKFLEFQELLDKFADITNFIYEEKRKLQNPKNIEK